MNALVAPVIPSQAAKRVSHPPSYGALLSSPVILSEDAERLSRRTPIAHVRLDVMSCVPATLEIDPLMLVLNSSAHLRSNRRKAEGRFAFEARLASVG